MPQTDSKMTHEELRSRCRHYSRECPCSDGKCLANYSRCTEANCPAFDAEDPVPLRLLIAEQAS